MKRQERKVDRKKIFVGISGGVDSAVSAALLKKAGNDVTGVFIKVWQPDWIECNWKEERLDAMRVAAHLNIPFVTLDLVKEYKKGVIDYMIAEYAAGRTPNPDVMCNREVKFGAFWHWAKKQGADYIATGHYTRINEHRATSNEQNNSLLTAHRSLLIGVDSNKDQSYFLWTLNQKDLAHIMFPVGGMTKPEVRKLAKQFKLPNADKKDSQGLCFIGKVDIKYFLAHYIKTKTGKVLNAAGKVIGSHSGALFFTIGERHGFNIDGKLKTPNNKPYFVVSKNMKANTITVGHRSTKSEIRMSNIENNLNRECRISNVNWVSSEPPLNKPLLVRSRYRQALQLAEAVAIKGIKATLMFDQTQDTLTLGQSLVIYNSNGEECLGGGVIDG